VDFSGRVSVEKHGRCGFVHVAIGSHRLRFQWEYGGGDCIAVLAVPDPAEWRDLHPHREFERDAFLAGLAREIARHECPRATIEFAPEAVYFLESS